VRRPLSYYNIYGLSRQLWIVEAGIFLNALGYGAVLPFEVVYLHDGRGFSLGIAGLVVGIVTGLAVVTAPLSGPVIDRFGARVTAAGAGIALAVGYAGLAFADTPREALLAGAVAGIGNGALTPSQSALLASLAPPGIRHHVTAVSRVGANLGLGLGGALGGLVAAHGLNGYVALFLANAVTYLLYVAVLVAAVEEDARPERLAGGYRLVLRDRAFVRLAVANVAVIAVGWGILPWVVPPYATSELRVGPERIGLLLLANALTVVLAQMPASRLAEGRRRAITILAGAAAFAVSCLMFLAAGHLGRYAFAALLLASITVGVGECLYTTALVPLVADLAPPAVRGRYMAAMGLTWSIGLGLAASLGTRLLGVSPAAVFVPSAALVVAAGLSALVVERTLPLAVRLTPRPVE
jgi:MFS family permease